MPAAKKKTPDSGVSDFYYRMDLTVEPPLPDSKAVSITNDYFEAKQIKDENVVFDPVEGIKVISSNVTAIKPQRNPDDYAYGYDGFKSAIKTAAKVAKDAGSQMNGQVIIKDALNGGFYRLLFTNNVLSVEKAMLGWPDGTNSEWPEGEGA